MIFLNEYNKSLWQKFLIVVTFIATIFASIWLMFADIDNWLEPYQIKGDFASRIVLLCCLIIYFVRVSIMAFVFLKRKLVWVEAITISILMPLILFALTYVGGNQSQSINTADVIGILLYLFGSYLNTYSEYLRYIWKQRPENKGRPYTQGMFKYSMHINYFGDVVLFTGWAIITQNTTMLLIPFFMALNFAVFIIPSLDDYLEKKYGEKFQEYANSTKRFIPFIY